MGDIIRLYRGDASKIKEFDFHKTNKSCYVGQGIYLTNDISLADTYRTKGAYQFMPDNRIVSGGFATKGEAIEAGLQGYARFLWETENERHHRKEDLSKLAAKVRQEYLDKIESGEIKFERHANYDRNPGATRFRFTATVPYRGVGFVTVFEFPRATFERDVIKIWQSPRNLDEGFLELVFEHRCYSNIDYSLGYDAFRRAIDAYVPYKPSFTLATGTRRLSHAEREKLREERKHQPGWSISRLSHNRLIQILKPYGFKGFEYEGGANTGGKRHRAFSIWDDDYVNSHRVNRIK